MDFNPAYENISAFSVKKGESVQTVVESAFVLRSLSQTLKIDCKCRVIRCELMDGYAKVEGEVEYKILYLNKENELKCDTFTAEFIAKSPASEKNCKVKAECVVVDSGVSALAGEEIKIASVIETNFIFSDCELVSSLCGSSSGFYLKDAPESYVERKCFDKAKTEYAFSDKTHMDEVVFSRGCCVINKRTAGVENVSLDGEVILEVIGTRNGEICCQTLSMPFSETFECSCASYGDSVVANAKVTFCDGVIISDSDGNKIDGVIKTEFDFAVYGEREFMNVLDVFSVKRQLLPTVKSHNVCEKISNFTILERVDGNVKLGDNMPACDVILSSNAFDVVINSVKSEDGSVSVEGVVSGRVIYSCSSPDKTVSALVSAPFTFSSLVPFSGDEQIIAKADVSAVTCRVRRGNEIDIKADIAVSVTAFKCKEIAVICELREGEEKEIPLSAFSVYVAQGGESLWEVSGQLGVTPDFVLEQNSQLTFPLTKGDRITVYRALDSKKI